MPLPLAYLSAFLLLLGVLILVTEYLHRKWHWPAERSRKFLHVSGGIMCLLFPFFFHSHWWLLPLAIISFSILFVTYRRKLLPSVHQTKRLSVGSVLFPVPVYACFLVADLGNDLLYYYLPVSLLTIADTAAETGGQVWGKRGMQFFDGQKTAMGTVCFMISAWIISFGWLHFYDSQPLGFSLSYGLAIAVFTGITECLTLKGWDNLTVPMVSILLVAGSAIFS